MSSISSLRSYRIFGIALFDLISAMIGLVIIFLIAKHYHFPNLSSIPFILAGILLAIPVGITFHIIFGTNTSLNYKLGLSNKTTTL
jgi:hypothetical protein